MKLYEQRLALILMVYAGCTLTFCYIESYIPKPLPPCSDYEMLIVNTKYCVSRCPIACVNGVCFENGTCPCDGYYQRNVTLNALVCVAQCLPGCVQAGGYCAGSALCICPHGLIFDAAVQRCVLSPRLIDRCLGRCKFGTCSTTGVCTCAQGYTNSSTTLLRQFCQPVCTHDCGPRASCILPNMCSCSRKHWHYDKDGRCHKDELVLTL